MGPWRGFKFSVSYKASKLSFRAFSSRRSSLPKLLLKVVWSLKLPIYSILMVQRLPYPEIPTLTGSHAHVLCKPGYRTTFSKNCNDIANLFQVPVGVKPQCLYTLACSLTLMGFE